MADVYIKDVIAFGFGLATAHVGAHFHPASLAYQLSNDFAAIAICIVVGISVKRGLRFYRTHKNT